MSIVIYTYHDPYKIDQEPYWDEIKNCPYFCSAQTLVNGLRSHYKEKFDGGRVSTVKILTDSLYVDWASPAWIVKQHTDIDNIINSGFSTDLSESERINIGRAFLFNRDDVFASIRTMFELNVDPSAILKNKLTKEQRFILGIYQKILASEMKKDFYLARSLAEEEIDEGLRRAITRNILLLSATPVQQRRAEYLDLLRLLLPSKYDSFTEEKFGELIDKQSHIIQKTALILDDLSDFEETIDDAIDEEEDPHESEDCQDLFEEIQEGLEEICDDLDDSRLNELFEAISFAENDLGVYAIKVMISYICSNYQIESNIIRNRRKLLEVTEDDERLLPIRELETQTYELDSDKNAYEALTYELLSNWILEITKENSQCVESIIRPLLSAFFSSPWAFEDAIKEVEQKGVHVSEEIKINAERWKSFEQNIINEISKVIDDPDYYSDFYSTRLLTVINTIYEELFDQKIVLFTNYKGTFDAYRKILEGIFSKEEVSFFGAGMSKDEIELNAYRFQNDRSCRIMLCDYTGGEGRNFQCADYIVHIDLPWDAISLHQGMPFLIVLLITRFILAKGKQVLSRFRPI
ncbi:MAG: hypothetical protein BHV87_00670 [Clostridiales bacterium 36_14]|nr:MAG: hypothetical protein BHV87_00670 [Clostridiales bacterium 36_14]